MLENPKLHNRSCSDCAKWVYNSSGDIQLHRGKPQPRLGKPTPCRTCPKENPQRAKLYELNSRNDRAIVLYLKTKAASGRNISDDEARDPILLRNFSIIEQKLEAQKMVTSGSVIATQIATQLANINAKNGT